MGSRHVQVALLALLVSVIGMGWYAYHLINRQQPASASAIATPEAVQPTVRSQPEAVLLLASAREPKLDRREVNVALPAEPSARAEALLHLLMSAYANAAREAK